MTPDTPDDENVAAPDTDAQIEELNAELNDRDETINKFEETVADLSSELTELEQSNTYQPPEARESPHITIIKTALTTAFTIIGVFGGMLLLCGLVIYLL